MVFPVVLLRRLYPLLRRCAVRSSRSTSTTSGIEVTPRVSLFDQKVDIRVRGLPCVTKVTVQLVTGHVWRKTLVEFTSCGHYVTSPEGDLQLHRDASLGGTYSGLDPMGLFWSLRPTLAEMQNVRMFVKNGDDPVRYTLTVYRDHLSIEDLTSPDSRLAPLGSTDLNRLKRSADVQRIPVREGGIKGTLFLPKGEGPHPGVIDLYGGNGGLIEYKGSLLASHGFAVLSLAYFRIEDFPKDAQDVPFDYFEEAVSWFTSHRSVKGDRIGVSSNSFGCQYAALIGLHCPQVKAVVLINGTPFFQYCDSYRRDGTLVKKRVRTDKTKYIYTDEGIQASKGYNHYTQEDLIPLWETSAHVLSFVSDDDRLTDPAWMDALHSMYPEDKRHLMEVVHYPGAGHLLEPPYHAFSRSILTHTPIDSDGILLALLGGNTADHAAAQEDFWKRLQTFFMTHLG